MYKQIKKDNKIFNSKEFLSDKYKYYIALKILQSENPTIYSNEEDYFLIRSDEKNPTWIWTKNNIDENLVDEVIEAMKIFIGNNEKKKFTCKKEFYDLLINSNANIIDKNSCFEMGTLFCEQTKTPKSCDGHIEISTLSDTEELTDYWYKDNLETGDGNITLEQAKNDVIDMINGGNTYVLKNIDNKIVCMASYSQVDDVAKINHVYTPIEERKKGYCANLIYNLSNMLLEKNITPMLYTDYNYIPSNKSYMNVGYEKNGILVSFYNLKEDEKNG